MKHVWYSLFLIFSLSLSAQNWVTDFETAKTKAEQENKQILLVFSGSDWCAPCIKLDKNIWQTNTFQDYAETHFILLRADFPRRKKNQLSEQQQKHNNNLAEQYNPNGYFPLVVLLNADGNILNKLGYKALETQAYINEINTY